MTEGAGLGTMRPKMRGYVEHGHERLAIGVTVRWSLVALDDVRLPEDLEQSRHKS
jgi:hypothetical protein